MARLSFALLSILALAVSPVATAQVQVVPTLTVNGVTASDNSAVPHVTKLTPLNIRLTGTPGAPFALLLSADAFDGTPTVPPEPNVQNGFFLKPWTPVAAVFSPIHPVFDGIGTTYIGTKLANYTPTDFLPDTPSPVFRFDANGEFVLNTFVPPVAYLADLDPAAPYGPNDPIMVSLETDPPYTIALYLQVVSLNTNNLSILEGNGLMLVFDQVRYQGAVAYSEAQSANANTYTLGSEQTLGTLIHADLANDVPSPLVPAPEFTAAQGFTAHTDIWMITLAGNAELIDPSVPTNVPSGATNPLNPDTNYPLIHTYQSDIEFLTGSRPARNNENFEYPRIMLPGNRELFHWRKGHPTNQNLSEYGFGVLFKDSNTFRNLCPANFPQLPALTESAVRSPWEIEVGVTPDGNRAMVVHDPSGTGQIDRVLILNLEEGKNFNNGFPIRDVTNSSTTFFARTFEESISFVSDGGSGWVGFVSSTNSVSTSTSIYPNKLWRVHMNGGAMTQVLPTTGLSPTRIDRNMFTSADNKALCVIAGAAATSENVIAVTNVTAFGSHTILDITGFTTNTSLMESKDTTDGTAGFCRMSKDGSLFAFARAEGNRSYPMVARTDGALKGSVEDLINDLSEGGRFDALSDFTNVMEQNLTDNNKFLLCFQGLPQSGFINDLYDLFVIDLQSLQTRNLTRTISGLEYAGETNQKAYLGPWDVPAATALSDRPNIDPGGSFIGHDRGYWFWMRDLHGGTGQGRFNIIAVAVAETLGGGEPTFNMTNVSGLEFEPYFGAPIPTLGVGNLKTDAGFITEPTPSFFKVRRVGGSGAMQSFYYFVGRLANVAPGETGINHLFLFDGSNPSPAYQISSYGLSTTPIAVSANSTITNVIPSQIEPKVAYILNNGGSFSAATQELIVQDLSAFGTPIQVPDPGGVVEFNRLITADSVHWLPSTPTGLVYAAGTVPRPTGSGFGSTDGVGGSTDVKNPVDASAYFFNFLEPSFEARLAADAVGANRRAVFVWNVK